MYSCNTKLNARDTGHFYRYIKSLYLSYMQVSFWEQSAFYAPKEVIVVGAGLQGLWCAYALKKAHPAMSLLVLERAPVSYGASTRNAGFACFGSPTELLCDARNMGEAEMLRIAAMRYKGIRQIQQVFTAAQTGFIPCGGYECLRNDLQPVQEVYDRLDWLNHSLQCITGTSRVFSIANDQLQAQGLKGFDALIYNPLEASLHSGKLVQSLLQRVREMGVEVLTGISVTGYTSGSRGIELQTGQQLRFTAQQALFCTNAFTGSLFPSAGITPGRGQIVLTDPIEGLSLNGTFHFDEGYYYFRNLGNRILLGGARNKAFEAETTTEIAVSPAIQAALEQFLAQHFSTASPITIQQRWAGIMAFTKDKQPVMQQVDAGCWIVSACNGMGVALAPVIAEEVAEAVRRES